MFREIRVELLLRIENGGKRFSFLSCIPIVRKSRERCIIVLDPPEGLFRALNRNCDSTSSRFFPVLRLPALESLLAKAREKGIVNVFVHDIRAFSADPHRKVDDEAYGGGPAW